MRRLEERLSQRKMAGNLRELQDHDLPVDFYSNDYLGLARNPLLADNIVQLIAGNKDLSRLNGSTGSRLLAGNNAYYEATEQYLAGIFHAEKALLFNSGYNANLSILSSVPQKGDTILYDELIHASMKDGARLSLANRFSFRHNDLKDLSTKLRKGSGEKFVAVESVYSMDGDFAPLKELVELCETQGAHLIVDEAHATGLWGPKGSGRAVCLQLQDRIFARIYTFGKAIGLHGACIAGSNTLIDYLINFARPFIYTTALPLHSVASVRASFDFIDKHPQLAQQLFANIQEFRKQLQKYLWDHPDVHFMESEGPIQVIKIPGNLKAKTVSQSLQKKGMDIRAILSPTVKEGEERLRICLHTFNNAEEIEYLVTTLLSSLLSKVK